MLVAAGLALAVAVPAGWWLTRPEPSAGRPVLASPAPAETQAPPAEPTAAPVATRDASLTATTKQLPAPVRIEVPSLDVEAPVVPAGVTDDGLMAIPEDVATVGWYRFGPTPGATAGTAVLAGHVDDAEQGRGALFDLRRLDPGDRITVRLAGGKELRYRVTGRETIVKQRLPLDRLFVRTGAPRLVLVTCGGPFDEARGSYRDNLVVAAEPEPGS